jgi:hypothetical protein
MAPRAESSEEAVMRRALAFTVLAALAAGCGGGSKAPGNFRAHPRQTLIVLYQKKNSDECQIKGASGIHAFRLERVEWEVWNFCDANHRVDLTFASVPGATYDLSEQVPAGATKTLFLETSAPPGVYKYSLVVDGTTKEDPKLEIDPYEG